MTRLFEFSVRRTLSVLAIGMAVSAPALADHWRQCPYDARPDPASCYQYHQEMRGGGAWPMMHPPMQREDMRAHMRARMQAPMPAAGMSGKQLGVMVSNVPNPVLDEAGTNYGVNVESVQPDSAAALAGIKAGDLITEFGGSPVYSTNRLIWLVRKAEAGKPLEIKLMREKQVVPVSATLVAPKPQCPEPAKPEAPASGT